MATNFGALSSAFPVANQKVAQGLEQGRQVQLQQAVGALQPGQAPTAGQLASQAAQTTQQKAQIQQGTRQQTAQQQTQMQQGALQQQQGENQIASAQRRDQLNNTHAKLTSSLSKLNGELGQKLYDDNLSFKKDELGRTLFNERQLADWAISKAQNQEDFMKYQQASQEASKKKMQIYKVAQQKIQAEMKAAFTMAEQGANNELQMKLTKAKIALDRKIANERAASANRAAMWQAGGTIAGAVVGTAFGAPSVGAAVGGGLGSLAGGLVK